VAYAQAVLYLILFIYKRKLYSTVSFILNQTQYQVFDKQNVQMGNRVGRRAQPQRTYIIEPYNRPGPAYPRRGYGQNCHQHSPPYAYQYPRYSPMQPYY
jgi:hypothetical protein